MIKLTYRDGEAVYLNAGDIVSVAEASTSSQWHGTRSIVRTRDGIRYDVTDTAADVHAAVERATGDMDGRIWRMSEALSKAARQFRHYEQLHRARGTDDGLAKAAVNADLAAECERVMMEDGARQ